LSQALSIGKLVDRPADRTLWADFMPKITDPGRSQEIYKPTRHQMSFLSSRKTLPSFGKAQENSSIVQRSRCIPPVEITDVLEVSGLNWQDDSFVINGWMPRQKPDADHVIAIGMHFKF
jgi:hypothetical protein